jgi:hypothetical protein
MRTSLGLCNGALQIGEAYFEGPQVFFEPFKFE